MQSFFLLSCAMQEKRAQYYESRQSELAGQILGSQKLISRYARFRLLAAIGIAGIIYLSVSVSYYFIYAALLLVILFFRWVKQQSRVNEHLELLQVMKLQTDHELKFLHGDKSVFDTSLPAGYAHHMYAADLDLFGTGSLYQALNRCGTFEGRRLLAHQLMHPLSDPELIKSRRMAIAELANEVSWRQELSAIGTLSGEQEHDHAQVVKWLDQPHFYEGRQYWMTIAAVLSGLSGLTIAWMVVTQSLYLGVLIVLLVLNTSVLQFIAKDVKKYFDLFGSRTKLFRKFSHLFAHISSHAFQSPLGKSLHHQAADAEKAYLQLAQLSNLADQRLNGLVGPIMNGFFLFDLWTINKIERWRTNHAHAVEAWVDALGQVDAISSMANYQFNHPTFCAAEILDHPMSIRARQMGHPLLPPDNCVTNDYEIGTKGNAHIITGSNMAGKSTFIRSVGLNLVMALNGLPVCAREFSCSVLTIASCIRITDSLEDNASYFKAELTRLQQIVAMLKLGNPHIVLLDEILRGTNSEDKRTGTLAFFERLKDYNCLALLATHDLVIGQLEEKYPDRFENYCFESEVVDEEIHFDYKLHKGVSRSKNASWLMRNMGLID